MSQYEIGDKAMVKRKIVYPDASDDSRELLVGERLERLQALGEFTVHYGKPQDVSAFNARIGDANAVLLGWGLPQEAIRDAPNLEVISFTGIGVSSFVDLSLAGERGITVCNAPGYGDNAVAEHALALMLAAARQIAIADRELRADFWNQTRTGIELRGKQAGLIGFGGIGQRFAELALSLGMTVKVWTRNPDRERAERRGVEFVELDALLASSDVVSVHVALTAQTEKLLGKREFSLMKPGAILVNTARGQIVDENALCDELRNGGLHSAGLDVFAQEPLPVNHQLVGLDNVVLSPHIAYNTPQATEALYDIAIDNLVAYFEGTPVNIVTDTG